MRPNASELGTPEQKAEAFAKGKDNKDLIMGKGTDAAVGLPGIGYANLYRSYGKHTKGAGGVRHTGKIMAAHEMMHALHYMHGMALRGRKVQEDDPHYRVHEQDKSVDMEELATSMVRNRHTSGVSARDYMINRFMSGADRDKALRLYQINESQLRKELGMMPLFSYGQKHDQSQVGDKEISQEEFEADKIPYRFAADFASLARGWDKETPIQEDQNPRMKTTIDALKKAPRSVKKSFRKAMWDANAFADRATLRVGGTVSPESEKEAKGNTNHLISQLKKKIWWF